MGTWARQGWTEARRIYRKGIRWVVKHVPPGVRTLLGLLLIAGGFLAFLPVFGLWMIPLGIGVLLLDVTLVKRWWHGRRVRWTLRRKRTE